MDPDPLRLLETAHPLRSRSISQGPPKPRFRIRPNCRLKRPPKLMNKTVNNFIKIVDGPTQMSRPPIAFELELELSRQPGFMTYCYAPPRPSSFKFPSPLTDRG